jgi:hypothetical protein
LTVNERQTEPEASERRVHTSVSPVLTTKVSLHLPSEVTYEDWEQTGLQLSRVVSSSAWWLGDWLLYGRKHYIDRYERAIELAGLRYQTLRNYAWVAGRYPESRRRVALSFQHHADLASLPVVDQERWLDQSENQGWSLRQLRRALQETRGKDDAVPEARVRRIAVPDERFQRWHDAAEQAGSSIQDWVMATLDHAADQTLTAPGGLPVASSTVQPTRLGTLDGVAA